MRFVSICLIVALLATACASGDSVDSPAATEAGSVPRVWIASSVDRAVPDANPSDVASVQAGLQSFAADLYGRLAASSEGNVVYSPVSVYVALAMTYAGAVGATAAELDEILGSSIPADDYHSAMNVLGLALDSRNRAATETEGAVEISIANSLWGQQGLAFEDEFLDLLAADYGAGMRVVDFVDPTAREKARLAINDWVADETNNRIEDLIGDGVLDELVRLVLVNAVYLKAAWLVPFIEDTTVDGPFVLLDGTEVQVPMMSADLTLRTADGPGWRAVEIPYTGNELAMLIVMPDQGLFDQVESSLSEGLVETVREALAVQPMVLALPKFEIRTQAGLIPALQAMGLTTATNETADFSGMTGAPDLFISDVIHEAWISVDEAGTEAAAATAVIMSLTAAPLDPVRFDVNRPFLFVLHDNETGSVLFMGRVIDPSS